MDPRQNNGHGRRQRQPSNRQHQRFSWQTPPTTPPEEETAAAQPPQPRQQPTARTIDTNVNAHNRAFSYAQTPVELRGQNYYTSNEPLPQSQQATTPIDPRPQSIFNPQSPTQPQPQSEPPTYQSWPTDDKPPVSPISPQNYTQPAIVSPVSPVAPQRNHSRQLSTLSPINTNVGLYNRPPLPATPHSTKSQASPLPIKAPITPISAVALKKDPDFPPMTATSRKSFPVTDPYSPHGFSSTTPRQPIFSPDAATGPNGLDFALHQPGQIAHPNMDMSPKGAAHEWKHSLCECTGDIGTCLTGLFCPCILYGRTSYRLSQKSDKKDPTDMLGYSVTNGHCMLMSVSCGLWWLFPLIQRTRIRHLYKLSGSFAGDLARGCCCCCCVAVQNEREVREREESARRWAGPASAEVYRAPAQMSYTPQR